MELHSRQNAVCTLEYIPSNFPETESEHTIENIRCSRLRSNRQLILKLVHNPGNIQYTPGSRSQSPDPSPHRHLDAVEQGPARLQNRLLIATTLPCTSKPVAPTQEPLSEISLVAVINKRSLKWFRF